jgi:hypothetical protein
MPFPVNEIYIKQTENKLGVEFPPSFKMKMMQENGGELMTEEDDWQLFPFFDSSDKKRLSRSANDIVHETESAKKWHNFPPDCIAIASNGSGDLLVFKRIAIQSRKLEETVYFWSHDTGELQMVASSFSGLIQMRY